MCVCLPPHPPYNPSIWSAYNRSLGLSETLDSGNGDPCGVISAKRVAPAEHGILSGKRAGPERKSENVGRSRAE